MYRLLNDSVDFCLIITNFLTCIFCFTLFFWHLFNWRFIFLIFKIFDDFYQFVFSEIIGLYMTNYVVETVIHSSIAVLKKVHLFFVIAWYWSMMRLFKSALNVFVFIYSIFYLFQLSLIMLYFHPDFLSKHWKLLL